MGAFGKGEGPNTVPMLPGVPEDVTACSMQKAIREDK